MAEPRGHPGPAADYALLLVDPPPLPPHERSWRHPSELAPTAADIDDTRPGRAALALGSVTVAVVAMGVIVLALTPARSSDVGTASATTIAVIDAEPVISPRLTIVTIDTSVSRNASLAPLTRIPNAVSAVIPPRDGRSPARSLPGPTDAVIVLTDEMTYRLPWAALPWLDAPDGSVVLDEYGDLLGRIEGHTLIAASPELVGQD